VSKKLANATLNLILAEVSKDLADPEMGSCQEYWNILSTGIDKFIEKIATCKHENTVTYLHSCGISGSGRKIICKTTYCKECNRTLKSEEYGKVALNTL